MANIINYTNRSAGFVRLLQIVLFTALLLYLGRVLFIPLAFALLISFSLYPVCVWLEQKHIPRAAAITICLALLSVLMSLIIWLLLRQIMRFGSEWPQLHTKMLHGIEKLSSFLSRSFDLSAEQQEAMLKRGVNDAFSYVVPFLQQSIYLSARSAVLLVLLPFYVALMLYHRQRLVYFLLWWLPANEKMRVRAILHDSVFTFYSFLKGMALVYLLVAILNSVGLLLLGIPHAILFGVMASVLTFIPYVGITIGALLPMAVAWSAYDSLWYPAGVVLIFTFVQYLEANFIFPLAVSARLRVNTLFTLIAIFAGGIIWGASGMILFIPFLGIAKLVADRYPGLKAWSVLLGTGAEKNPPQKAKH